VVDAPDHGGGGVIALPLAWAALILTGAWRARPRARAAPRVARARTRVARSPAVALGALAIAALVLPIWLAAVLIVVAWAAPAALERRARARHEQEIARSLPEIVDLFHLAVAAGLNVTLAVDAVARRATGPLVPELAAALDEVALGRRLGDALSDVPARAGERVRPLVTALVASDRYGSPLGDALGRLAAEVRADRRRRAEEIARRVPVKLLFPLVCCVLPAFGLLTLAPLIAGAVSALRP
jgi:tight adherence protein C